MPQKTTAAPPLRQMRVHLVAMPIYPEDKLPGKGNWERALGHLVAISPTDTPLRTAEVLKVVRTSQLGVVEMRLGLDPRLVPVLEDEEKRETQIDGLQEMVSGLMTAASVFAEDEVRTAQLQYLAWNWEGEETVYLVPVKDAESMLTAQAQAMVAEARAEKPSALRN